MTGPFVTRFAPSPTGYLHRGHAFSALTADLVIPLAFASFVGAVSGAILSGMALEVLGLGPQNTPTLGMTIYWALLYAAFARGMWWWWGPPVLILVLLFIALFLMSAALDEVANPRLRQRS